jgi:D-apionolactonase
VCRWLVFHVAEKSTGENWIRLARARLSTYDPKAAIVSGTNAYFAELNRGRPPVQGSRGGPPLLDMVCYSINPQVHAFDNASLVENLEAQASTVESARQFVGELPLAITPVTLRPRFNPDATGPQPEPGPGELPSQVDVRQMSLFGAGWTLGSLKHLSGVRCSVFGVRSVSSEHRIPNTEHRNTRAERSVESVTYYETTGWRGVMETEAGSPLPAVFRSFPGAVFPLYHVLADVREFAGGEVLMTTSSQPLQIDGVAVRKEGRIRVILASFSPKPSRVTVGPVGECVRVRRLDETNVREAMQSPEGYRAQEGNAVMTTDGALTLELLPFAVVRIDTD